MFRVFLLCTDFGFTSVATYGSRNTLMPKALPVPHSIATERFENIVPTTSEDPRNHAAVLNEKSKLPSLHQRLHTKTFRLPTSVTNKRFETYEIFKIIKVCPNNITVNQVSRTIAYTKKSQFVHKTN